MECTLQTSNSHDIRLVMFVGVATIRGTKLPLVVNTWPSIAKHTLGRLFGAVLSSATMNNNNHSLHSRYTPTSHNGWKYANLDRPKLKL